MVARRRFFAGVMGLACLLGGCTTMVEPGLSGDVPSHGNVSVGDGGSPPPTSPAVSSSGSLPLGNWVTEMDPLPPLEEYGVYLDGPGEDPATVAATAERHDAIEKAIAACMTERGFRYVPTPFEPALEASRLSRSRPSTALRYLPVPRLPDDRDTVVREGYGVMPSPDAQSAAEGYSTEDPNVGYQSSLSPAEADAYSRALQGDWETDDPGPSCSGDVVARFPDPTELDRQQVFEVEFGDVVWAARVDVASDPRTVRLDQEWESCMNHQGYEFEKLEGEHGPILAMGLALRTRPDGSLGPFHREGIPIADVPVEEKSLLGTEPEREVAVADFDCRVETDYMARLTDIRWSMDEDFIREHHAELERLVAASDSW